MTVVPPCFMYYYYNYFFLLLIIMYSTDNSIQEEIKSKIEVREWMLSLSAEFVVFQFAIQKLKD
jgi:hypothetical protein